MINTTPRGVRRMKRRNPGSSVSWRPTSAREDSAIESIYLARSSVPRISPAFCDTGLRIDISQHVSGGARQCEDVPPDLQCEFEWYFVTHLLELVLMVFPALSWTCGHDVENAILTRNLVPIASRSFSGTRAQAVWATAARLMISSSCDSEGYVRVTSGCWL